MDEQNDQSENEASRQAARRAFQTGLIDVKGLVAPDPIDRYSIEQSEFAIGFASFLIEQTVNGITNSARWAFRRLHR